MASLFKYLPENYVNAFIVRGEMLFRSLSYYRNYEELDVRGDPNEGLRLYRPAQGLNICNQTTGEQIKLPWSFESSVKEREIFVFCLSQSYSAELAREFNTNVCIEIHNPAALMAKIRSALMIRKWVKKGRLIHSKVSYYSPTDAPLSEWAVPERVILHKTENYLHQQEYRLAFAKGNALDLNNVLTQITSNTLSTQPTLIGHPEHILRLGNLKKLCTVRYF